jgi:DNA modification methylase
VLFLFGAVRMLELNKIHHGDSLEELKKLPDNSIDSCVTDPPYGLSKEPDISEVLTKWMQGKDYTHTGGGFMGKTWDSFVPGPALWSEVYRILKPGGYALVFAGTRTQDLMTIALRMAGFEVRDVIEWLYFSGFPKNHDVGKAFDRRRKEDKEAIRRVCRFIRVAMDKKGLKSRDLVEHFNGVHPRLIDHWAARDTDSQPSMPKIAQFDKLKEVLDLSNEMDAEVWRLNGRKGKPGDEWSNREKVDERPNRQKPQYDKANGVANFAGGSAKNKVEEITAPATELARKWDGWGTALKPAHEPIIVVRKPLDGTVADTVEKHGTGAINVDGSRIASDMSEHIRKDHTTKSDSVGYGSNAWVKKGVPHEKGRFPANIVTTEDNAFYSKYANVSPQELSKKASKKDRNSDWRGEEIMLEPKEGGTTVASTKGQLKDLRVKNPDYERKVPQNANNHPTVKPIDLMAWLVRLVTPEHGTVLDPFAGSGTTGVAAKREGFSYVLIEQEQEYITIANERTKEHEMQISFV